MTKLELSNIPSPNRIKNINIEYNGFGQSAHSSHTVEIIIISIAITIILIAWALVAGTYITTKKKN